MPVNLSTRGARLAPFGFACAFVFAAPAAPANDAASHFARRLEALPQEIARNLFRAGPVIDLESVPGLHGLGASLHYASPDRGLAVSVFVCDRGARRAPEGGGGDDVVEELRSFGREVGAGLATGEYRSAKVVGTFDARDGDRIAMRCATLSITLGNGQATSDAVCVAVDGGDLVRVRLTITALAADPPAAGRAAAGFAERVLSRLGPPAAVPPTSATR